MRKVCSTCLKDDKLEKGFTSGDGKVLYVCVRCDDWYQLRIPQYVLDGETR